MIYATGFGARSTLLSLITTWIPKRLRARLYSAVFLIEQGGMLIGERLVQNVFAFALSLPKSGLGLQFFCMSVGRSFPNHPPKLTDQADPIPHCCHLLPFYFARVMYSRFSYEHRLNKGVWAGPWAVSGHYRHHQITLARWSKGGFIGDSECQTM